MKKYQQPSRLPQLPRVDGPVGDYLHRLSVALEEWLKTDRSAMSEADHPPLFSAVLTTSQSLAANTLTKIAFDSVLIDTITGWDGDTYTPPLGVYRASWGVNFHDSVAFATSTFGYAQCGGRMSINNGNGTAQGFSVTGSTLIECDGTTGISVEALILAGTAPVAFASGTPYRCWLDVAYVGRI